MDEVQTLRLFFFDLKTGRQYRDTKLKPSSAEGWTGPSPCLPMPWTVFPAL